MPGVPRPPCRLYFLLAREAAAGVLFRRGPSRWVQLIRWNTAEDTFEPGQWFKGRIYEKRSDLSPDGSRLIYFAQKISRRTLQDTEYTYAWTAISRPPYLTALALWPKGDCWNGGGLFETNSRVWLNHFAADARPHERHQPRGLEIAYNPGQQGEDHTVLDRRLTRDGWRLVQAWQGRFLESAYAQAYRAMMERGLTSDEMLAESLRSKLYELDTDSRYVTDAPEIREKPDGAGRLTLVMTREIQGFRMIFRFGVRDREGAPVVPLDGAEWAEWDQRGRLVLAGRGQVSVAEPAGAGAWAYRPLADVNAHTPQRVESPAWARDW